MSKRSNTFSTVRTEGAILPPELLMRVLNGDPTLDGVRPSDYHLSPAERLNEAATRAYNRLAGVWSAFKETMAKLPDDAIGTTETRERWLLPLFQELGYGRLQPQRSIDIEGKSYPISHQASEPVAIHLISCKWDLDKRNPIAKSETKLSPHSLMQEFLNRSPDHLWGFLSNGYKLRILRDNVSLTRAAYVEFDLQTMLDNESYSDFFLLYLLCHQSRVEVKTDESGRKLAPETCWLERWYNTSLSEGVRALDELRDSVQFAIESLGAGFLLHPANTNLRENLKSGALSVHEYYTQVLRQVYRLLLIFVAEDRDLLIPADVAPETKDLYLKYYSTYRIRELAQRKRGTRHTDLWQQLKLLFASLHSGNPALGLPALGSYLFMVSSKWQVVSGKGQSDSGKAPLTTHHSPPTESSTPDLADCQISNSDLLSAIRSLCYTQKNNVFQPINYRNLGPEELGSVYESLLEMSPEVNLEGGYFKLSIVSGSERKTTGSYYTPTSLVNCLLDSALEPVIERAVSGRVVSSKWLSLSSEASPHLPLTTHHSPEQALLALKICDPACGSGHFLIAAAHRLAKRLASIRAGEEEPAPSIIQHALRDVIGHCVYGVDLNPMAVELCKISLWMEALEPGKPLTFLDHHIQCGNSLLGCTPELLGEGIPDAAFTPLTGDDKAVCSRYRKLNKDESKGSVIDIFSSESEDWLSKRELQPGISALNDMSDDDLTRLQTKEQSYANIVQSQDYQNARLIYDAWCAAFVWIKDGDPQRPEPITHGIMESIKSDPENVDATLKQEINRLADQYRFFHWHLAFPDVFPLTTDHSPLTNPGFDCVLGNPPWERVKLQEKEFFSARDADIANAPNAATRKRMIDTLPANNPLLYQAFLAEKRVSEGSSLLIRESGRYPLCGRGDVNTYTVFAELNRILLSAHGRCGCIVPSGIATDDTTKFFFQDLTDTGSLVSIYDFENREGIFPGVHRGYKFCLLTLRALQTAGHLPLSTHHSPADFVFFAHTIADLSDAQRHFQLSAEDIALINPNTRTCPIFRSKQDAELTKYIYRLVPVLFDEENLRDDWELSQSTMFHSMIYAHLFLEAIEWEKLGYTRTRNVYKNGDVDSALPLVEGKSFSQYDHRAADVVISANATLRPGQPVSIPDNEHRDPFRESAPRAWVQKTEVDSWVINHDYRFQWFLAYKKITGATNERTLISTILPYCSMTDTVHLILLSDQHVASDTILLESNLNSYMIDFIARFKVGTSINFYALNQLPILNRFRFNEFREFILPRAIELNFTSYSLQSLGYDSGYEGPPFIWDEERRFEIKCELDSLFFHLYLGTQSDWGSTPAQPAKTAVGPEQSDSNSTQSNKGETSPQHLLLNSYFPTPRHAVEYIMETFPIVKRKDEKEYGEYRTKRRILEIYDAMTPLFETTALQASAATASPLTTYHSPLDPPPGPPCDADGNFIPVVRWDTNNWPKHIHKCDRSAE